MAILPLNQGGTGSDLSGTGGPNQFVKQTSSGANLSVAAISTSDISSVGVVQNPTAAQKIAGKGLTLTNSAPLTVAQMEKIQYVDSTLSRGGVDLGDEINKAYIALSINLATTAASVTSNLATLTMVSNPMTFGFVAGQLVTVAGFSGADSYFNGFFTLTAVTSTTVTYSLSHANATASTNGNVQGGGGRIIIAAGTYGSTANPLTTINFNLLNVPVVLEGAGMGATVLNFGTTKDAIHLDPGQASFQPVVIRDLMILGNLASFTTNTNVGITLAGAVNTSGAAGSIFQNVSILGFGTGIKYANDLAYITAWYKCVIYGNNVSLLFPSTSGGGTENTSFFGCDFSTQSGSGHNSQIQFQDNTGDVYFYGCSFADAAIVISPPSSASQQGVKLIGCHLENPNGTTNAFITCIQQAITTRDCHFVNDASGLTRFVEVASGFYLSSGDGFFSNPVLSAGEIVLIDNPVANITAFSIASNVVTFTAANSFIAGEIVVIAGLLVGTYLNGQTLTVLSTGLSGTQFEANFTHANVGSTSDSGTATLTGIPTVILDKPHQIFRVAAPIKDNSGGSAIIGPGPQMQKFLTVGTFTNGFIIPTTQVKVTVVAGGGAGGGATTTALNGGGGGSGSAAIKWLTGLTPGNTLSVTVGAGGTANSGAAGGSGSSSSVSSGTQSITTITTNGGTGGGVPTPVWVPGPGGAAGSGGDLNLGGTSGLLGTGASINIGGPGAPSIFGGGGYFGNGGIAGSQPGQPGTAPGAGGGGAGQNGVNQSGGAGAAGAVIFEWTN